MLMHPVAVVRRRRRRMVRRELEGGAGVEALGEAQAPRVVQGGGGEGVVEIGAAALVAIA